MKNPHLALRKEIIETCIKMNAMGINQGTSGNVSARVEEGILITPSAVPYERMKPDSIVRMNWDGRRDGGAVPSTEWRFHLDITRQREDVGAIVHTHSVYATILSIRGESIPAVHYMIAAAGG
ncbi:MAG: class II aldolase/adducin family protein, partial [Gammaproteobacteria bacterium]|nr:class II aldolase/adducin family protein [Gammaproteobacteria bacterium]